MRVRKTKKPPMRLSGLVRIGRQFAVAEVELSPEEWEALSSKKLGTPQAYPEFVALEHKRILLRLADMVRR